MNERDKFSNIIFENIDTNIKILDFLKNNIDIYHLGLLNISFVNIMADVKEVILLFNNDNIFSNRDIVETYITKLSNLSDKIINHTSKFYSNPDNLDINKVKLDTIEFNINITLANLHSTLAIAIHLLSIRLLDIKDTNENMVLQ